MEEAVIEVVSRDTIKPSSPTPQEYIHYQLSFIDQITPPVYNPLILFYSSDGDPEFDAADLSFRLKTSLSETLTLFYPLAGRLKGNICLDCNDEGIPYLETRVKCRLTDVVENPDPKGLRKLVPFALNAVDDVVLGIQFNVFECRGIAIGICLSHKIADALCLFMFTRTWAAICRGEVNVPCPEFVAAKLFPPINISGFEPRTGITTEDVISKRFIFKSDVIDSLKARYSRGSNLEAGEHSPSRVEALSAFIWSRFAAATRVHPNPAKTCFLLHAVNLRTKFEPPLPEYSFGNLYRVAMTYLPPDMEEDYLDLVPKMRETIRTIDQEYVQKLRDGQEHFNFIKKSADMYLKGEMISFNFTSLCRFPLYEADFGWGKPTWVGSPALMFKNLIVFIDTKSGDGIEAYIHLNEEDMAKFEKDEEFQSSVSPIAKTFQDLV